MAAGEVTFYEKRRRQRLWQQLQEEHDRWATTPPVFVEAPPEMLQAVYQRDLEGLPGGVELVPGRIPSLSLPPTRRFKSCWPSQ
jgi:hypothetical protein